MTEDLVPPQERYSNESKVSEHNRVEPQGKLGKTLKTLMLGTGIGGLGIVGMQTLLHSVLPGLLGLVARQ